MATWNLQDADINTQRAFRDLDQRINLLEDLIRNLNASLEGAGSDAKSLRAEIAKVARKPNTLEFTDVFRASGPAHALGYVPDPGPTADNEKVLLEAGEFGFPVRGQVRAATDEGLIGSDQKPGDIANVLGSLAVIGNIGAAKIEAADFIITEAHGGTLVNPNGILATINVIAWQAPYACSVVSVRGYRVGGTSATINARRNGSSNHLGGSLSLTSTDAWLDGGSVQNGAYVAGDKLEIMLDAVAGSPTQIGIQVIFRRT